MVLVSHDRAFLNNVTTRTIEISCGRIYDYKVKYDEFVVLRKERREQQLRAYENQQKQIEDTEAFIERFRYKATKAVQVQSRIKQLEKIERIEPEVRLLQPKRKLSRHLRRRGESLWRPRGFPRRQPHHQPWREGGLRGQEWRR